MSTQHRLTGGGAEGQGGPNEGGDKKVPWFMAEPEDRVAGEERPNPLGLVILLGLFALLWLGAGFRYFVVVVGLLVMIFLHEMGHFVTARLTGMKATQFFLFMGPRIFSFHRGETEYGLRLLPLGAFVRIVGMNNLDPCTPDDEPRAYKNKSYPRRMLVITAGSMMHFLQALVLFVILSSVIGAPDPSRWTIGEISRLTTGATPAEQARLEPGDTIAAVDGVDTSNYRDLQDYLRPRPGEEVTLSVVDAGGTTREVATTLASRPLEGGGVVGFLGVAPAFERNREHPLVGVENFGSAMWSSISTIPRFLAPSTFVDLGRLLLEGPADVSIDSEEAANRPVSMVGVVRLAGDPGFDWTMPVTMLAYINIFVGVFNLLPLLPLDGGHAAIATYERIRSRRGVRHQMDVAKLLPVTYAVVLVLGFLMLTTLLLDIVRPIS
ncbi:MAG: site-2 protease family protein [Acidimicrobiia bacterium]|nr:site-2 protease family protein [Acidimicrobiia bacterium]MDH4363880.1 site-2 protease family protein [Acidimicrobiia bacterium]MDH5288628.1 site-2 protease family protein [Acidimicrobiia bacterium]